MTVLDIVLFGVGLTLVTSGFVSNRQVRKTIDKQRRLMAEGNRIDAREKAKRIQELQWASDLNYIVAIAGIAGAIMMMYAARNLGG